jgi:phosphohistidine phosphatase
MKLYLVRHGHAPLQMDDHGRSLSEQGRAQVKQLAQRLLEEGAANIAIYHSGLLRAQQTADILAQQLGSTPQQLAGLRPDDIVDIIVAEASTWQTDTLLVSHLPYLPQLLEALCPTGHYVEFHTATAVCLESTANGWRMVKKVG